MVISWLLIRSSHFIIGSITIIPGVILLALAALTKFAYLKFQKALKESPELRKKFEKLYKGEIRGGKRVEIVEIRLDSKKLKRKKRK